MTEIITTGNFKGGVGKTTNAVMISYTLAKQDKKVLLVDLDPQANATALLLTTMAEVMQTIEQQPRQSYDPDTGEPLFDDDGNPITHLVWAYRDTSKDVFENSLFVSIEDGQLEESMIQVMPNLDLLPSSDDLQQYERFLYRKFDNDYDQDHHFAQLLAPLAKDYDYVIMDVPPQLNKFTDSAIVASNYIIVVLQTQERSLSGAEKYIEHLLQIQDDYNLNLDLLGILPVLLQNGADLDLDVISDAESSFGEGNMFNTQIKQMARLKRFDRTGITDNPHDIHDRRVHGLYKRVVAEALDRIQTLKGAK